MNQGAEWGRSELRFDSLGWYALECPSCKARSGHYCNCEPTKCTCKKAYLTSLCPIRKKVWKAMGSPKATTLVVEPLLAAMLEAAQDE